MTGNKFFFDTRWRIAFSTDKELLPSRGCFLQAGISLDRFTNEKHLWKYYMKLFEWLLMV